MSSGGIAAIVIFCLVAVAGGTVFFICLRKHNYEFNKLFGNQRPTRLIQDKARDHSGFDNVVYENDQVNLSTDA